MTAVDEFTVDSREHIRRRNRRWRERQRRAITSQRTGLWTPVEDAIVLRWDLLLIEKIAILQRSGEAINTRLAILRTPLQVCPGCGSEYHPRRNTKTCSRQCGNRQLRSRPFISCAYCGVTFKRHKPDRKYCSWNCFQAVHRSTDRTKICQHCGSEYHTKKPRPDQRYCSQSCFAKANAKTHCKRGHEFTPENTRVSRSTGYRSCQECNKIRDRAKAALKRRRKAQVTPC